MTSTFSEPPRDFGVSDAPASRYTKQLAALEQRCQSAAKDTQSWRLMTFGMTGLAVATMAACLYVASLQPTPAVHVVEIDGKTGETMRHQVIGEPIPVSDAMVSHMIGRWIQLTRSKSIDPVVLRSHWEQAYQFVPVEAKAQIDAYPFEEVSRQIAVIEAENERRDGIVAAGVPVDQLDFDYEIDGDEPSWRPVRAFNDGSKTYVEFPRDLGTIEAPPLFLSDDDGSGQLVNYRVKQNYYGVRPPYGVVVLGDGREAKVQNTARLRRWTLDIANDIRAQRADATRPARVRPTPGQCRSCGLREHCTQRAAI